MSWVSLICDKYITNMKRNYPLKNRAKVMSQSQYVWHVVSINLTKSERIDIITNFGKLAFHIVFENLSRKKEILCSQHKKIPQITLIDVVDVDCKDTANTHQISIICLSGGVFPNIDIAKEVFPSIFPCLKQSEILERAKQGRIRSSTGL